MKERYDMSGDRLEELLNEMRDESVAPEEMDAALERVRRKLANPVAQLCEEFRPQISEYAAGEFAGSRRLLLEDHLSRCADCRRVLAEIKGERKTIPMPMARPARAANWPRWAIAAGIAAVALFAGRDSIDRALGPTGPPATVESAAGSLYRVAGGIVPPGVAIGEGETIRTGPGARAVLRLTDGSTVEVNERTELSVRAAWSGQSIQLERGDIIVQAARQRRGRLSVATRDSVASVKGTIFAVSAASAGSLVSVVEGSVAVAQPGGERLLNPGEQAASSPALASVPMREAIAWSEDAEKYYALLGELVRIEKQLAALPGPAPRTEARLVRHLPANAVVYGAIPNVGGTIRQAVTLIEQRAAQSAVLREWWTAPSGEELRKLLDHVQSVTPSLGEEIVFILSRGAATEGKELPAILAEVTPGQEETLRQALARIPSGMAFNIEGGLLVVSDSAANLAAVRAQAGTGASSVFAAEIAQRYARGAGWLVGIDVSAVPRPETANEFVTILGVRQMRHMFFEQRSGPAGDDMEAVLTFAGTRSGVASWLAPPAASGSAEYASSEAVLVVSASTKNPRQAFDELLALVGQGESKLAAEIRRFESETGVNLSNDLAAALGTDFTIAVERPSLPVPGWFVAVEVVQPGLFEGTVQRLVENVNRFHAGEEGPRLEISQESTGGREWTRLKTTASPVALSWTHDRGYLIASTDRAIAANAIATRNGGFPLVRSARFRENIPGSGTIHQSGFFWLNTNGALAPLAEATQSPALQSLLGERDPVLIILNGEAEQIHAASRTRITGMLLDLLLAAGNGSGARRM